MARIFCSTNFFINQKFTDTLSSLTLSLSLTWHLVRLLNWILICFKKKFFLHRSAWDLRRRSTCSFLMLRTENKLVPFTCLVTYRGQDFGRFEWNFFIQSVSFNFLNVQSNPNPLKTVIDKYESVEWSIQQVPNQSKFPLNGRGSNSTNIRERKLRTL